MYIGTRTLQTRGFIFLSPRTLKSNYGDILAVSGGGEKKCSTLFTGTRGNIYDYDMRV